MAGKKALTRMFARVFALFLLGLLEMAASLLMLIMLVLALFPWLVVL